MGRRRSFVETEAIQKNVALNDWQIEEVKKGVAEADRGDFATAKDVEQTLTSGRRVIFRN